MFAYNFGGIMDLCAILTTGTKQIISKLNGLRRLRFIVSHNFVVQEFGSSLAYGSWLELSLSYTTYPKEGNLGEHSIIYELVL
jgi:hypothetical protein